MGQSNRVCDVARSAAEAERALLGMNCERDEVGAGAHARQSCWGRGRRLQTRLLDPLQRLGDVAHREVGQGEGVAGPAPAGIDANRGRARVGLPALSLVILASLELLSRSSAQKRADALGGGPFRVLSTRPLGPGHDNGKNGRRLSPYRCFPGCVRRLGGAECCPWPALTPLPRSRCWAAGETSAP